MTDINLTPYHGVPEPLMRAPHDNLNNALPPAKRKRVDGSEDEVDINGDAPLDLIHKSAPNLTIQEQIANLISILKR